MTRPTLTDLAATLAQNPALRVQRGTASASAAAGGIQTPPAPKRAPGASVGREAELQRACEQWLMQHGIEYLHLSPRAREHRGWPDLTYCLPGGIACAVELKSANGTVSEDQAACLARMEANGWRVAVIRSLAEFVAWNRAQAARRPHDVAGFYPQGEE